MKKISKDNFYAGKKVLVTGGTGLVGFHIVQELLRQGAGVRITTHRRQLPVRLKGIARISADLSRQDDCLAAAKGVDYIFHAAGVVSAAGASSISSMSAITENLVLTARILQAAWIAGVERFLLFSSSTIYPAVDHPVKEEEAWGAPPHPSYFGYGWMRLYLEKLAEFVALKSGLKIAIVRPTAVYGRWDDFSVKTGHVIPALICKAVAKQDPYEVWGTGDEIRDFLHASDLARGCLLMLQKHATCDPVNIGYGKTITIKDIVSIILRAAGHDKARVIFNSSKPTTIPVRMVDISKAKKQVDFVPKTTLRDGLIDTVRWYMRTRKESIYHGVAI